jgi:hypothetical protein
MHFVGAAPFRSIHRQPVFHTAGDIQNRTKSEI